MKWWHDRSCECCHKTIPRGRPDATGWRLWRLQLHQVVGNPQRDYSSSKVDTFYFCNVSCLAKWAVKRADLQTGMEFR